MKKAIVKFTDKLIGKTLKLNVNSTSSLAAFQPDMPIELKRLSKVENKK